MNRLVPIAKKSYLIIVLGLLVAIINSGAVLAAKNNSNPSTVVNTPPIVQSFDAGPGVYPGMLVALNPRNPNEVVALTDKNVQKMLGVVVPVNNAQVALVPSTSSSQQVLVAESGRYSVLVSNEGGPITIGQDLTMSSVAGIAMKAGPDNKISIGQAEDSFNGSSGVISTIQAKNNSGSSSKFAIGSIFVNLHLSQNSQYVSSSSGLPQFVIQAAYTIAKKPVSPVKIYLGFVIIFAIILIVSTMFYSATKNGIISIGRNPLSRQSIAKGLTQTIIAGLLVFGVGVGLVYAIIVL